MRLDRESYPLLAHSLVRARPERVQAFVAGYTQLADDVAIAGTRGAESVRAHANLVHQVADWEEDDEARGMAEQAVLSPLELSRIHDGIRRVLARVDEPAEVVRTLRSALDAELTLPALSQRGLQRCLARFDRLVALAGPGFALFSEAQLIATHLDGDKAARVRLDALDWRDDLERGCVGLLRVGIEACLPLIDGERRGIHIGIPLSRAVNDLLRLHEADLRGAQDANSHEPLETKLPAAATYPFVPAGRMHKHGAAFAGVRDHGEGIGPLGWAIGDELLKLIDAVEARVDSAGAHKILLIELSQNLRAAHQADAAVVGCFEWMSYEADDVRNWLVSVSEED